MSTHQDFNLTGRDQKPVTKHPGLRYAHNPAGMTLGINAPLEAFDGPIPSMANHVQLIQQAEKAGFAQLWLRDVPLYVPRFGDTGQVFDTFTYLGYLAAVTERIALGTAGVVLPLRHPIDVAKAAASVDQLSGGRLVLGVASGDRPVEFPAYRREHGERGELFRESLAVIRQLQENSFPEVSSSFGDISEAEVLPKPTHQRLPMFITGSAQQTPEWIAENSDGWLRYTVDPDLQAQHIATWRRLTAPKGAPGWKPFNQATAIDLLADPKAGASQIHLGLRLGREALLEWLKYWEYLGIDQLMLTFKTSQRPVTEVIEELAEYILPHFPAGSTGD